MNPEELRKQLKALTLKRREVDVDGLGTLTVTELTGRQRIDVSMLLAGEDGQPNKDNMADAFALATAYGLGLERKDLALIDAAGNLVMQIGPVVFELSGLTDEAAEAEKND